MWSGQDREKKSLQKCNKYNPPKNNPQKKKIQFYKHTTISRSRGSNNNCIKKKVHNNSEQFLQMQPFVSLSSDSIFVNQLRWKKAWFNFYMIHAINSNWESINTNQNCLIWFELIIWYSTMLIYKFGHGHLSSVTG